MAAPRKFDPETRERAVRMYHDHFAEHGGAKLAAREHVGALLDINQATLRNWIEKDKPIGREERTGDRFGLGRECERLG